MGQTGGGRAGLPRGREAPLHRLQLPLLRSLATEARCWAAGWITGRKYRMPGRQRPDGTAADSGRRIASRLYGLKTGHASTGQ